MSPITTEPRTRYRKVLVLLHVSIYTDYYFNLKVCHKTLRNRVNSVPSISISVIKVNWNCTVPTLLCCFTHFYISFTIMQSSICSRRAIVIVSPLWKLTIYSYTLFPNKRYFFRWLFRFQISPLQLFSMSTDSFRPLYMSPQCPSANRVCKKQCWFFLH